MIKNIFCLYFHFQKLCVTMATTMTMDDEQLRRGTKNEDAHCCAKRILNGGEWKIDRYFLSIHAQWYMMKKKSFNVKIHKYYNFYIKT